MISLSGTFNITQRMFHLHSFGDLDDDVDIDRTWVTIQEDINTAVRKSLYVIIN
jgi:hypothetical protein